MYSSIHGFKFLDCEHSIHYICEGPIKGKILFLTPDTEIKRLFSRSVGQQRMSAKMDDETLLQVCKDEEIKIKAVVTMQPTGHLEAISNGLTKPLDIAPLIADNCRSTLCI